MVTRLHQASRIWQPVIGLEIHAQLATKSKLFSGAGTSFSAPTNTQVAFHDVALPGTLPVLNRRCVELGIRVALALNCEVHLVSEFDRKHYFYADLPAGFQITQQRRPIANNGRLSFLWRAEGQTKVQESVAEILQVQLEQDSGRSIHSAGRGLSFIDLNRAGVGLVEIVTAPSFVCSASATAFVYQLREVLMAVGACSGDMSKGALRVDANISVHRPGEPLGVRSEVKNLNSLMRIRKAIDFEIRRQTQLLAAGEEVVNETRTFDADADCTLPMRDKEKVQDYRFCPEPNLPPLRLVRRCSEHRPGRVCVECERASLPAVLPPQRRQWLHQQLHIPYGHADVLLVEAGLFSFFLDCLPSTARPDAGTAGDVDEETRTEAREVAYWLSNFLLGQLRKMELAEMGDGPWTPQEVLEVSRLRLANHLDQEATKELLKCLASGDRLPGEAMRSTAGRLGLLVVSDPAVLRRCCLETLAEEAKAVKDFRRGKRKRAWPQLVRQAGRKMDGRLHKEELEKELKRLLSENKDE